MRRRTYLTMAGAAVTGLAGCIDGSDTTPNETSAPTEPPEGEENGAGNGGETDTGVLSAAVSDGPSAIGDFESLVVTVEEIWLHPSKAAGTDDNTATATGTPEVDTRSDDSDVSGGGTESPSEAAEEQTEGSEEESDVDTLSLVTDKDGTVTFEVPENATGFAIRAAADNATGALIHSFKEDGGDTGEQELDVTLVGEITAGENATVKVADEDGPVVDAAVDVAFEMPSDVDIGGEEDGEGDGSEGDSDDGKVVIDVDDTQVDLVEVQGDAKSLVSETELEVSEYESLKLHISNNVEFTLKNGDEDETTVETAGNAPLKFNESFEIRADTRTTFTADFAPHTRGKDNSQGYLLKPVPSEVEVAYDPIEEETDEPEADESSAPEGSED